MVIDMREMKDSGFPWIGEVPNEWDILRVKDGFFQKKAKAHIEDPTVLSLARSGVKVRDMSNAEGQFAASYYDYNPVVVDDLLLNPMDLVSGDNCSISTVEGVISPAYVNLRFKKGFNPKFYHYYFKYQYLSMAFFTYGKGVSFDNRWTLNSETLMKYPLLCPDYDEQTRITNYLDSKCAEIDYLSADIQSEIDTLEAYKRSVITETVTKGLYRRVPMKDSGIPWIGMVPEHWKCSKIKYEVFPVEKGITEQDGIITCFRDGEVTLRSKRREDGFTVSITENGYHGVDIGDLVIHGMDAFAGAIGCSDSRGKTTPVVHVCETSGNNRYFMYCLRSMASGNIMMDLSDGIRVRSSDFRNFSKLGVFGIAVAPLQEQNEIVTYLDEICYEIESIIAQKQEQLTVLADYKKSIIYEYVTGKKAVI